MVGLSPVQAVVLLCAAAGVGVLAWRRRRALRAGSEAGVVAMAIIWPAVIALVLVGVQGAVVFYAKQVAITAAQEGVRTERVGGDGQSAATSAAESRGGRTVSDPRASVSETATDVEVTVTVQATSLLPLFGDFEVTQSAHGPVERFTEDTTP
jgi:Flp pilus assembly protein TadG